MMQDLEKSDGQVAESGSQHPPDIVLDIIRQLDLELHPHQKSPTPVTLDTSLDGELGLDSLGRVELFARLEQAFGVSLPDNLLIAAETPRDLVRALPDAGSGSATPRRSRVPSAALEEVETFPDQAETLLDVLDWHAERNPERLHVRLLGEDDEEERITYSDLREGAKAVAIGLMAHDLQVGQTVAIMLPTGREYLHSFFGVLAAGGIPVPIYPPVRISQLEDHLRRHAGILANAQARILITVPEGKLVSRLLKSHVETLHTVVTAAELAGENQGNPDRPWPVLRSQDIGFLQYTSGSTGEPKGVVLTHANLLANIRAMGLGLDTQSADVMVSWLPLYHDMGLIGAWLGSLYYAMPLVLMSPLHFLARPEKWLWAIHRYRGTISAGVNFAYELCLRRIKDDAIEGLDLSSWRVAANGAESVSPDTIEQFTRRFGEYGFRPEAMLPVYGLAENTVGLAFSPMGKRPMVDRIDRQRFVRTGNATAVSEEISNPLRFVACGQPLPGHQIRIVDEGGHELGEREEGRLQFKGPSATSGFYRNPVDTRELFDGDWLVSGDLAYIAGGQIFITGRAKDIIIRAGRNIYPHEMEEAVGNLPGIRKGCVVVFGSTDPGTGTERLVVVAEIRESDSSDREKLQREIANTAIALLGSAPEDIVLAPPYSVLKTSSGKLRRAATRKLYEQGRLSRGKRSLWLQLLRIAGAGTLPELRRVWRRLSDLVYVAYFFTVLGFVSISLWSLVAILRRPRFAWPVVRATSRFFLKAVGLPLVVREVGNLPADKPVLLVVNHSSYLDGLVLCASLPGNYSFVAKRELLGHFVPRIFLRNLGALFVERSDTQQSVEDAGNLMEAAQAGRSLIFFPEGTFQRTPGLLEFHLGAFKVAAESDLPVVPLTIRGTRSVLRDEQWFPRRGALAVHVGVPIIPRGPQWSEAIRLRDEARGEILKHCGEPDLAGQAIAE